ncbi:retrovirus-related pol polyprotein from transposon opus [Lasius niger]|uniref:RNA-directed DNA polymerase n=1 Tax=Lasius niger TaxID=67767 RepID=A0A0J7KH80_LASNI|nr:retrovirus-related pol polyprotein from transposon opus [Lasius niger]
MDAPQNISELRSFMGSINYLSKFIPQLVKKAKPLNDLLSPKNAFIWDIAQEQAFQELKNALSSTPILAWFHPLRETIISADASAYGFGAVLKQRQENGEYRPIAYASRTLTAAQRNWAQIEKEGYALQWACEKFKNYITGLERKEMGMADILSRRPLNEARDDFIKEVVSYARAITTNLPATDQRLQQIREAQAKDPICQQLKEYISQGWPKRSELNMKLHDYWQYQSEFSQEEGILMKGSRIVIPQVLRKNILEKLHEGHLGITKCRNRAQQSVWWPGLSTQIERLIRECKICVEETHNRQQPLMPTEFPRRAWQRVGMDLFHLNHKWYLIVTDYYSRYPEIALLKDLREDTIIKHLKSIFARHGIPETVVSDNGTQFGSIATAEFTKFANEWGFQHVTSSLHFPQSNGLAEIGVQIIKRSLKKCEDPYEALINYRSVPLANGYSPAELLMGRRIRTKVPIVSSKLLPKIPDQATLRSWETAHKRRQKQNFDRRHGVRKLPELHPGEEVWITDLRRYGKIIARAKAPRSYLVETEKRTVRRNRVHLIPVT